MEKIEKMAKMEKMGKMGKRSNVKCSLSAAGAKAAVRSNFGCRLSLVENLTQLILLVVFLFVIWWQPCGATSIFDGFILTKFNFKKYSFNSFSTRSYYDPDKKEVEVIVFESRFISKQSKPYPGPVRYLV